MSNSFKGLIFSLFIHACAAASIIYLVPSQEKKEVIKTVVMDINMIESFQEPPKTVPVKETPKQPLKEKKVIKQVQKKIEPKKELVKKQKPKPKKVKKELPKKTVKKKEAETIKKEPEKIVKEVIKKEPKKIIEKKQELVKTTIPKESKSDNTKKIKTKQNYERTYIKNNLSHIAAAIKKYKKYPYLAKKMGYEGKSILICTITETGELKDIKIKSSSGYKVLDRNSIEILKLASKEFKAPSQSITLHIPFNYYIN